MEFVKLDPHLITEFRNKVNENWAVFHIYQNHNGEDQWGIICSAMDWITVGVEGIDISLLSGDNSNDASRKMMTFLSCIDVMWEGITQLHRVLYETDKIPLRDEHIVFNQKKSDNEFFKDIRAIFMAHPVNLRDIYQKSDKWYASWSGGTFSKKNFSVFLYSNIPGQKSIEFPIKFSELLDFANRRYMLLYEFMKKIDENIEVYNQFWRRNIILTLEDPIEHINLLIIENEKRWNNDWISARLEYLFDAFTVDTSVEKNKQILNEYRAVLLNEINEIHHMLQNVDYDHELKSTSVNIPHNLIYMYDQLFDGVPAISNIGVKTFRPIVSDLVDLDDYYLSIEGIRVLIDAAMWKKSIE